MLYRKADKPDIDTLINMRIEFLSEDKGLTQAQEEQIRSSLMEYFPAHLGCGLMAYFAEQDGEAVSVVFLLIEDKPANKSFPAGRTGTILNVYTRPAFRRRGLAGDLMKWAIADARARSLPYIDLKAMEAGRHLYESLGFVPETFSDVPMRYDLAGVSIEPVTDGKERYRELLLMADEQWNMIERYLYSGDMYVMTKDGITVCVCVVTDEGDGTLELKNIATSPDFRGRGYATAMIEFLFERYKGRFCVMMVGTGDSPAILPFYEKCGFKPDHVVKDFFTDNYDHPMYEGGVLLADMVYLSRAF